MKSVAQLLIGILIIAAVGGALVLSDKYLKRDTVSSSDQSHNPSNRLQKIRDGMREQ